MTDGGHFLVLVEAAQEFLVFHQLHAAVVVLDDGGQAFDPIAGVEVVDIAHLLVFRSVDVAADDALALFLASEVLQELPMEFAVEARKLLDIELEGSVG